MKKRGIGEAFLNSPRRVTEEAFAGSERGGPRHRPASIDADREEEALGDYGLVDGFIDYLDEVFPCINPK